MDLTDWVTVIVIALIAAAVPTSVLLWQQRKRSIGDADDIDEDTNTELQKLQSRLDRETVAKEEVQKQLDVERTAHEKTRRQLQEVNTEKGELRARAQSEAELREAFAQQVKSTFATLSREALSKNKEDFMQLAGERFERLQQESQTELKKREMAVENLVKPIHDALSKTEEKIGSIEKARTEAYGAIKQQLERMGEDQNKLTSETGKLVSALKRPQVRGRYGELGLRRVVELAGMNSYCDFDEQVSNTATDGETIRPDMVLQLPSNRTLVVDAKMPLEHYLRAIEAESEEERKSALNEHAKSVRQHVNLLGRKDYWNQFPQSPDFVVMFINGEQFLTSALEHDATLLEDAMDKKIILATPASLMGLLRAVAYGWRQEDLSKSAREIQELGKTLYDRITVFAGHFEKIGKGLRSSSDSYNKALGSLERNLSSAARKLRDHGIHSKKQFPESLQEADTHIRQLSGGIGGHDDDDGGDGDNANDMNSARNGGGDTG